MKSERIKLRVLIILVFILVLTLNGNLVQRTIVREFDFVSYKDGVEIVYGKVIDEKESFNPSIRPNVDFVTGNNLLIDVDKPVYVRTELNMNSLTVGRDFSGGIIHIEKPMNVYSHVNWRSGWFTR